MTSPGVAALRRRRCREGAAAVMPSLVGTGVWGVITGVAMVQSGLTPLQALGMSLLVFSGTTQLVALPLMVAGASQLLIAITAALTGLRFVVYSASVSRDLIRVPLARRLVLGYLMTDTGLGVYQMRRARGAPVQRIAFYLGCNLPVWAAWHLGSIAGVLLASVLSAASGFAYLGVLAVLAITAPMVVSWPGLGAALVAATVAVAGWHWPYRLGMFAAIVAGVITALAIERALARRRGPARGGR